MTECSWCGLDTPIPDTETVRVGDSTWLHVCQLCITAIDNTREVIMAARDAK